MSELPHGWTTVRLGEVADFTSGGTPAKSRGEYWGGNVPWITSADIDANGAVSSRASVTPDGLAHSAAQRVAEGTTLLVTRTGVGKVAVAPYELSFSQDITAIVPSDRLDPEYLRAYLRSRAGYFDSNARGATIKGVTRAVVASLSVPLPPLPEQRRIATILDKATSARRLVDSSIERYRALRESLIEHSLREVYAQAEPLGELLDFLTSGSRGWAKYYSATGAKFLRIQNVRWGDIHSDDMAYVNPPDTAEARRTAVKSGDVLLSITADLGRTAVVPPEFGTAHINQHLAILRTGQLTPEYLSAFLESSAGMRQLTKKNRGQTKDGLNFDDIRSVLIPRPPSDVERELVAQLHHFRYQTERLKLKAERAQDLLMSLQSRAFQGSL